MAADPGHRQARNAVSALQAEIDAQVGIPQGTDRGKILVLPRVRNSLTISRLQGGNVSIQTFVAFFDVGFKNVDCPRLPTAEASGKDGSFDRGAVLLVGE
jgi:hypothetical protein